VANEHCSVQRRPSLAREGAAQFLALAEKQGGKVPFVRGHRVMGNTLLLTGNFAESLLHHDQSLALYDPVEHRPLATRFVQNPRVAALIYRSLALWALGYPEAGLAGAEQALCAARETGLAGTLMHAMHLTCRTQLISGDYATAQVQSDELIGLAEEKGSVYYKATGMLWRASLLAFSNSKWRLMACLGLKFLVFMGLGF
jgi:predicted ATPase